MNRLLQIGLIGFIGLSLAGCTFMFQTGRRSDVERIEELSAQLAELGEAKKLFEESLAQEIKDKQVSLKMLEKGLVITVVGDLLFDSGKAKIRTEGYPVLDKVSAFLKENVPQYNVGIEGHTDNQPIEHSGWKSNWELSTARALSVLHYLDEEKGVASIRLSAIGYGEFQSVASNDTKQGRQLNRRVEIVILPRLTKVTEAKTKAKTKAETSILSELEENLK